jgi:hypothetical protein
MTAGGLRLQSANGQALPAAGGQLGVPLPTWKEKQDKMN